MLKQSKTILAGLLVLLGSLTFSCSKQDPTTELAAVKSSQSAHEDLVSAMLADPLVKADVLADSAYAAQHDIWYSKMSKEERVAHKTAFDEAIKNGTPVPHPSHTDSQQAEYVSAKEARNEQILAKYPKLTTLTDEEFGDVIARVLGPLQSQNPEINGSCGASYVACCRYCRGNRGGATLRRCLDDCLAMYLACLDYQASIRYA